MDFLRARVPLFCFEGEKRSSFGFPSLSFEIKGEVLEEEAGEREKETDEDEVALGILVVK